LGSEQAVAHAAEQRAEAVGAAARERAARPARGADDYRDRQLAQFESDLGPITNRVAAGRARLVERARGRAEKAKLAEEAAAATPPPRVGRAERTSAPTEGEES